MAIDRAGGEREFLQVRDYRVLAMLVEAAPRALSRSEILDRVWGEQEFPTQRTVDNAIVRLRQALGDDEGQCDSIGEGHWISMGSQLEVTNAFRRALAGEPQRVPPIWLMRQAGRYHRPYQELRQQHRFEELCRVPELAAEVAMGPIRDFDFDAAILFSDLLFPLEALGMSLSYDDGPPKLDGPLDAERIARFRPLDEALPRLQFQAEAIALTRARAAAGEGPDRIRRRPVDAVRLRDGRLARRRDESGEVVVGSLSPVRRADDAAAAARTSRMQLEAGADVVMVLDTAAGELPPAYFHREVAPDLVELGAGVSGPRRLLREGRAPALLHAGDGRRRRGRASAWTRAGILPALLARPGRNGFVQGNFDPAWLFLPHGDLVAAHRAVPRADRARSMPSSGAAGSAASATASCRARPKRPCARSSTAVREAFA